MKTYLLISWNYGMCTQFLLIDILKILHSAPLGIKCRTQSPHKVSKNITAKTAICHGAYYNQK